MGNTPLRTPSQRATFAEYAMGLLSDAERKSMEPLAAQARPDQAGGAHKAFVYPTGTAVWDDRAFVVTPPRGPCGA